MSPHLEVGACSHEGLVRPSNQDAHLANRSLVAVADGMGGHSGGEVASRIVVEELDSIVALAAPAEGQDLLTGALVRAHSRIKEYGVRNPADLRAGTTVVAALLTLRADGPGWLVANVGDSRAYLLRDGQLLQVTTDHSVVTALVEAGLISVDEAEMHPERHVLTRAMSASEAGEPDFFDLPGAYGTRLLLCSDGVSGLVPVEVVGKLLASGSPQQAAERLVAAALAAGGTDNSTAVVADVV